MIKHIKEALVATKEMDMLICDINKGAQETVDSLKVNGFIIDKLTKSAKRISLASNTKNTYQS